jgi:hypothetical protein
MQELNTLLPSHKSELTISCFYFSAADYSFFFFLINRLDNTITEISINMIMVIFAPLFPNFGRITQGSSHRYTAM